VTLAEIKAETARRDYVREGSGKLTLRDVLAREWDIVQIAKEGIARHGSFVSIRFIQGHEHLPADQREAIHRILTSRDFITLFRGGAGTGKSYVLRHVQQALNKVGLGTRVIAPQRQQVMDLAKDGLAQTETVAAFLQSRTLLPGTVVIIDEAGQIGGRQFHELLEYAKSCGGRIILSGDTRQHGPVEASDALRAIERHSGLRPIELTEIRRQDPERGKTDAEKERIRQYRQAVKEAAAGDVAASFNRLDKLGAIVECNPANQRDQLADAYCRLVAKNESSIIVSQTWAEIHETNEKVRAALRAKGVLTGNEHIVTTLERLDLSGAQKLDSRFYPEDHVVVFNRKSGRFAHGDQGRLVMATRAGVIIEVAGKVRLIKPRHLEQFTICRPKPLQLCRGDRLQLKANGNAVNGEKLANSEVVTVAAIERDGRIQLTDCRILPANYRRFVRGYAVTSYGSQGKTVDHVLFTDSAIAAATNAQQWYVTISRGRKSVQIFTTDRHQLSENIERPGDRPLAVELAPSVEETIHPSDDLRYIRRVGQRIPRGTPVAAKQTVDRRMIKKGIRV
jgi:ATP-dependent exoDNAse (exonuclease V) alpha subunit